MGALLSICGLGQLACCATSTACSCLSFCTPSLGSRLVYSDILLFATIIGWIMIQPDVSQWLQSRVPFCWKETTLLPSGITSQLSIKSTEQNICDKATGYMAVYRLMFGTFLFFILLGIIMIKIRSKRDPRVALHRGFWLIKFVLLISAIVGAFYIPKDSSFDNVWRYFGFIGLFLFLMIQVCFLILFADEWANEWNNQMESSNGSYFSLLLFTLFNYILSIVGLVLFYIYYGGQGCALHNWLISINMFLMLALSLLSISPQIQEYCPQSGLLQASMLTLYLTYMTWSALNSSPYGECKPKLWSEESGSHMNWQSFITLLICFACVIYSTIRLSSKSGIERITGLNNEHDSEQNQEEDLEEDDEDYRRFPYFYWFFALATLYLMMTLTNWFTPNEHYERFGESKSSLWIKIISSWLSALIYLWSLIAPAVLHDCRDFS